MARKRVTSEDLRRARDNTVNAVVEQGKKLGIVTPDVSKAEAFVDPIIRKIEVDEAEAKDVTPSAPEPKKREPDAHGWVGEAGHSPRVPDWMRSREGAGRLLHQSAGNYRWNLRSNELTPAPGTTLPREVLAPSREEMAARLSVRAMKDIPKYAFGLEMIHKNKRLTFDQREEAYRRLIELFNAEYGHPLKPLTPRVFVHKRGR